MDDLAQQLRRRIERYRSYLRGGLDAAIAVIYLKQIGDDEAALIVIERREKKPEPLGGEA
jgi:hypothetical protein